LPPSPWPADAIQGELRFSSQVASLEKRPVAVDETVIPGTCEFKATLTSGDEIVIRIIGLNPKAVSIKKKDGNYIMSFEGARDYVKYPNRLSSRTLNYWIGSVDSHYIRFTFTATKDEKASGTQK